MKRLITVFVVLLLGALMLMPVSAATQTAYSYNSKSVAVKTPEPYTAVKQISGFDLGVGELVDPSDLYCDYKGFIYICDTGNNRIIKLNPDLTVSAVIDKFKDGYFEGTFASPSGVYVDPNSDLLYIADTDNGRVIALDNNLEMVKRFNKPEQTELFGETLVFAPTKVVADNGGRLFIVAKDIYEGLMQYDSEGNFLGYVGANEVTISPFDYLWKKLSTKAQSSKLQLTLPTEFSNLEIDSDGFIYTTTSIINTKNTDILVRRQNPSGEDVLHRSNSLSKMGDVVYDEYATEYKTGASNFVDVTINGDGMYSLLDSKRGRIFTYDFDGQLLYIFGSDSNYGNNIGSFYSPTSMIKSGDKFIVSDIANDMLTIFEPTEYGNLINSAVSYNYNGKYEDAAKQWKEVLKLNANCEQAYVGIGISQLRSKDYVSAMENFKLGSNKSYYSKAFKAYRQLWLEKNFVWIVIIIVALLVAVCVGLTVMERNRVANRHKEIKTKFGYAFYCVAHPFDGFYVMKREKRGSMPLSLGIIAAVVIGFIFSARMTGFIINNNDPAEFSLVDEIVKVVGVFGIFCVINWCVTALMDGEGKLTDIICCTATGLIPLAISLIPLTLISNVLIAEDVAFYYVIWAIVILYTAFLIIVGVMETHQYTFLKTIGVLIITILGMVVAVFLAMLFINLINTMYDFIIKIYNEVTMR